MRFHLDVYLKFYEYQFYALCSLILVMNVNAEVHFLRFLHNASPNTMMLSRGFASRYADSEYTPLESNLFCEAILGFGHTFKNADEFRNAIY